MKKFYSINIHDDFTNILKIESKKGLLHIVEDYSITLPETTELLKNKKNFYIVVNVEEAIDDIATVPSIIKKDDVLKSYLISKFKETLTTKHLLLNYRKISEDTKEEEVTYKVDAVSYKTYVEKLEVIDEWLEIKSATTNKFALFNLTKECFQNSTDQGYISIHSYNSTLTVLAVDEDRNLLFERTSAVSMNPEDLLNNSVVDEVSQTIAYIKQQFRHIKFSTLLMSGSLSFDDILAEHLMLSLDMSIAVLYPNTFLKGLTNEEPQHYISAIGGYFVSKEEQFLPQKILSLRLYQKLLLSLALFSAIVVSVTSFNMLENYNKYNDALDNYDSIKAKLLRTVKNTDTYSLPELQKSWKHLQNAEKFLNFRPQDSLIHFKPLIDLVVPRDYSFKSMDSQSEEYSMTFIKKFQTLGELYNFEKIFVQNFNKINEEKKLIYSDKTNYSDMTFSVMISQHQQKKVSKKRRRRR